MRYPILALTFISFCLFLACGGNTELELESNMASINKKIQALEDLSASSDEARALADAANKKMEKVRALRVEGEFKDALELVFSIDKEISPYLQKQNKTAATDQNEAGNRMVGIVEYRMSTSDEYAAMEPSQPIISGMYIRNKIRSSCRLNLFDSGYLHILPDSEVQIVKFAPRSKMMHLNLIKGFLDLEHNDREAKLTVQLGDYTFETEGEANFAMGYNPFEKSRYFANFLYQVKYLSNEGNGFLNRNQSLKWGESPAEIVFLASTPTPIDPNHLQTIFAPQGEAEIPFRWQADSLVNFSQFQVSQDPDFATKVYDDPALDVPNTIVKLTSGTYYWRVRGINREGVPGDFCDTRLIHVKSEQFKGEKAEEASRPIIVKGPALSNIEPSAVGNLLIVTGDVSGKNSVVTVNGVRAINLEDGKFRAILKDIKRGDLIIEVVAIDNETGGQTVHRIMVKI